jgi:hypothetical protein
MGHGSGIYIWFGVRGLGGIGRLWGLDRQCPTLRKPAKGGATEVMNSRGKGWASPRLMHVALIVMTVSCGCATGIALEAKIGPVKCLSIQPVVLNSGNYDFAEIVGRWPTQARFWLEWGSSTAGQSLPAARSRFRAVHSDSISTRSSQPVA